MEAGLQEDIGRQARIATTNVTTEASLWHGRMKEQAEDGGYAAPHKGSYEGRS